MKADIVPLAKRVRSDRNTYRETLLRYHRIWSVTRDQQAYKGRQQTYLPMGRRLIENWTKRLVRDLFPQDRQFDVAARRHVFEQQAQNWKGLLGYFFEKHTRLRRNGTPWVRQLVTLGTSPVKVVWNLKEREIRKLESVLDPITGRPTGRWETTVDTVIDQIGPTFRPVDLFSFYVYPYTVADVDDAELAFEDIMVPRDRIRALAKTPILPDGEEKRDGLKYGNVYENEEDLWERVAEVGQAGGSQSQQDKIQAEQRRLADKGFSHPLNMKIPESLKPVDITECVVSADYEDEGRRCKYLVTLGADDVVLRVQQIPFFHGRAHWLCGKFLEVTNEFYGRGLPEEFDKLQYFVNDVGDQASDALVWSLNPIAVVDIFACADPSSLRMRPGAKWMTNTNPTNAVKFVDPPKDSAEIGFNTVYNLIAMGNQFSDVAPVLGAAPKTRNKNQKNMELAIQEAQVDVIETVRNLEVQVMEPFLYMSHALTAQYLDRDIILTIQGADGSTMIEQKVGVGDIVGDFEMSWLASTKVLNEQVRTAQMIQALGFLTKLPPEALAAQNAEIGWADLLRDFFEIGLGLPHASVQRYVREKVKQMSMDPDIENQLFRLHRGAEVLVSQADDDVAHAISHQQFIEKGELEPDVAPQVMKHLQAHVAAHLAKEQLKVLQAQQQAASRQGLVNAGGGPDGVAGARLPPPVGPGRPKNTGGVDDLMRGMPRGGNGAGY